MHLQDVAGVLALQPIMVVVLQTVEMQVAEEGEGPIVGIIVASEGPVAGWADEGAGGGDGF